MAGKDTALIRKLPTGVPGLDEITGGGLPEYSFNVLAGAPGSGKTTLAHQIMFTNASPEQPALYFTLLGEPPLKMLRYQQQFDFFDREKVGEAIQFVNLAQEVQAGPLDQVLERIVREVEAFGPRIVVVDSFRSMVRTPTGNSSDLALFVQNLSLFLASHEATSFLIGEYEDEELRSNPVFTVADGIVWLTQAIELNAVVRKIQVRKMRGQGEIPGLHGYRISTCGLEVFPRIPPHFEQPDTPTDPDQRLSFGVPRLDELTGGGIPEGDVVLVAGPVGSGKSVLGDHFIVAGLKAGEPAVIAIFDERPGQLLNRGLRFEFDMQRSIDEGLLKMVHLRPTNISGGEMLYEIRRATQEVGAKRVLLDSLAGLEVALAPTFREEFRESLCWLVEALVNDGITVMGTIEIIERFTEFQISPHHPVSFAVDDVIMQRYVEIEGRLESVMCVVKMRSSSHNRSFHLYRITSRGMEIGEPLTNYHGLLHGVPRPLHPSLGLPSDSPPGGEPPLS